MRQPDGPSYDYFAKLLPPLRYVNAAFRHYPIVLSAPRSPVKARLVSNGSAVNARGGLETWSDVGIPVSFRVGQNEETFGADLRRLDGPRYFRGYLPLVEMAYRTPVQPMRSKSSRRPSGHKPTQASSSPVSPCAREKRAGSRRLSTSPEKSSPRRER